MSIVGAFMVPHPPMIVSEVGKGSEHQVEKTIESYKKVAEEIANLNPETIIISSPHAPLYIDYFYLSSSNNNEGSFANFGAPNISFKEEIDTELVDEISNLAYDINFPAGRIKKDVPLDHGSLVPLYFIRQRLSKCKIVIVGLSSLPLVDNYKMGTLIKQAVENINRRVVYVASGDLSHKLQTYGPYGFAEEGPIYDKEIMDVCSKGDFSKLLTFDEHFLDKAAECGHRSFTIMAGALDGQDIKSTYLSHEDVTGVGYGICTFYPKNDNKERLFLDKYLNELDKKLKVSKEQYDDYVKLAQHTIEKYITSNKIIEVPTNLPSEMLNNQAGVFVSIHKFGNLRGCIGTILPTTSSIAKEIINNAISASTQDPRFEPITKEELNWLEINVDVLGPIEDIDSKEQLDVKKYGVIVTSGSKRGLLLPNLDGIDDVDTQISIASKKGNITKQDKIQLQRFEVIRHK